MPVLALGALALALLLKGCTYKSMRVRMNGRGIEAQRVNDDQTMTTTCESTKEAALKMMRRYYKREGCGPIKSLWAERCPGGGYRAVLKARCN